MKKIAYFVFFVLMLFVFTMSTYASEVIVVNGGDVRFRVAPNTSKGVIASFNSGTQLILLNKNAGVGNGCSEGYVWYKGRYENKVGYICSKYALIQEVEDLKQEDYPTYGEYLIALGFPTDYVDKLTLIHEKYPNWKFTPMKVPEDFNEILRLEYDGHDKGWSLLEDTGHYFDGLKSFDTWSYNYLTNEFSTKFTGGGWNWYAASRDTIAYYLDPRNFLDEKYIFMFENLAYNELYHTKDGVQLMLNGSFMESGFADLEGTKTFVDAFMDAGITNDVSPYVLVSRVIQEVGVKGSTIVSGTVAGYEGYYNFYNIKAAGNSAEETIAKGLNHAVSQGWNTKYKAIVGGASFLGDDYFSVGQDSLYLQKWDVIGKSLVDHQYMQNIQAPYHEASKMYNGYSRANLLGNAFIFTIPVFNNMPEVTKLPNKGNPNNYLSSLSVNGGYLFKDTTTETEFDLNLDINTTSIQIDATKVASTATVSGTGTVALNGTEQIVPIVVTAENGDVRTYNINVTRSGDKAIAVSEILRLANIKNDGNYMFGFVVGTDISEIQKNIIDKETKASVITLDKDGNSKINGAVASGDKVKINTDSEEKEYTIIINGEVTGDGVIDKLDALAVVRYFYQYTSYDGALKAAADVNGDNVIDKLDALAILRDYYGYAKIEQ